MRSSAPSKAADVLFVRYLKDDEIGSERGRLRWMHWRMSASLFSKMSDLYIPLYYKFSASVKSALHIEQNISEILDPPNCLDMT